VEVKSIRAANIRKTHEKLKAQIENPKDADKSNVNISINSANRVFGELMGSSIKKSLNSEPFVKNDGFTADDRYSFHHFGDESGTGGKACLHGGSSKMNNIMNIIIDTPDIRLNKTDDILKKIQEGTYKADYLVIADKLLSHDVVMRL
jgi:anti-sigma28 factor (negative regulator of flagellin synthesis)